jgi:serine protease Do
VKSGDDLVADIASRKPGSKAKLAFVRNGKKQETTVTIADRSKIFAARLGEEDENQSEEAPKASKFGMTVRSITPDLADRLGIAAGKGVVVQDVKQGSFAEDLGLNRGDVILEVNKQPVNNPRTSQNRVVAEERAGCRLPGASARRKGSGWNDFPGRYTSVTDI